MLVQEMKLGSTVVKFFYDLSNNTKEANLSCFENTLGFILDNVITDDLKEVA